jgi:carbamoyl-phosphate synthase large subunit
MRLIATRGTAGALAAAAITVEVVNKVGEGPPHIVDRIRAGQVDLVVNTPGGRGARTDGQEIRRAAVRAGVPCITTIEAAEAAAQAIRLGDRAAGPPVALQDLAAAPA